MNAPALSFPGLIQPPQRKVSLSDLHKSYYDGRPILSFNIRVPEWEEYERTRRSMPVIDHRCVMCWHPVEGSSLICSFLAEVPIPDKVLCNGCWKATSRLA